MNRVIVGLSILVAVGCGGSSGGSNPPGGGGQGSNSWSVTQTNSSGQMVSCTNYTNQKYTAAQAATMVQGGTVSANPCPSDSTVVGVCSGVDAGGNDYQQVFYNYNGLAGTTLSADVADAMISCSGISGTWATTYNGMFNPSSGGNGAGGTGGGSSGGNCAKLLACCNATSSELKTSCMSVYTSLGTSDSTCAIALSMLEPSYCPGL